MLIPITWWLVINVVQSVVLDPSLHLFPSPPLRSVSGSIRPEALWAPIRVQRNIDESDHDSLAVVPIQKPLPPQAPPMALKWYYCQSTSTSLPPSNFETTTLSPLLQHRVPPTSEPNRPVITTAADFSPTTPMTSSTEAATTTTEASELMDKAETFWPALRTPGFGYGSIHVPLTFSFSGGYGRYGSGSPLGPGLGVIGSSYTSVSNDGALFGMYGKSGLAGSSYGSYGTRVYGGNGDASWSGWGNGKWGHYGKG